MPDFNTERRVRQQEKYFEDLIRDRTLYFFLPNVYILAWIEFTDRVKKMTENKIMQEVFEKLKELQGILMEEFEIEADIENIPKELNTLKRRFQRVERSIKENDQNLTRQEGNVKRLEKEKEELNSNKKKYEGQISLIKTQREYEAITSEIAQIQEKLEAINEEQANALAEIDEMKKGLEEQKELHAELKTTIEGLEKDVKKGLGDKGKELEKCMKKKEKISAGLDEEIVYKFEKIVKKKDGIGIVSIRNNVCMGCNMILPPQFVNDVRREERIIFCPNCSRILYFFDEKPEDDELVL